MCSRGWGTRLVSLSRVVIPRGMVMPRDEMLKAVFHSSHELGAWILALAVAGHAAVALFHHFIRRDDVLACMAPVIAKPSPERNTVPTLKFPTETHSGNKGSPLAVLQP